MERLGRGTEAGGEVGEGDRSRWRGFGILSSVYVHNIAIKNIIVQRLRAKDKKTTRVFVFCINFIEIVDSTNSYSSILKNNFK